MSRDVNKTALAQEVWQIMSDLVLANQRRREVADAAGMSFGRTRAIRRVARKPMSMGELAGLLGMERPNATTLVNDLEEQGLVVRRADPKDRRTRLVEATPKGKEIAQKAEKILMTPPTGLEDLSTKDLETIRRCLDTIEGD